MVFGLAMMQRLAYYSNLGFYDSSSSLYDNKIEMPRHLFVHARRILYDKKKKIATTLLCCDFAVAVRKQLLIFFGF